MKKAVIQELQAGGMSAADAAKAFDTVFAAVAAVAHRDGVVRVAGFGTFKVKYRQARNGRNPLTGESIRIEGRDVLTFKEARQQQ